MAEGDPIGLDLALGTFDGSTLPELSTFEEKEVSLGDGYALVSGTQYAIVIRNSAAASEDAITISGQIFPNADYAGGYYADSDNAGSTWSQDDWIDIWFKTKAEAVEKDTYTDTGWQNRNVYGNKWYAQIITASSSYTITSVILRLSSEVGGTPGVISVSIKAVSAVGAKAVNPSPSDVATDVTLDQALLTWDDGGDTDEFLIYYGTESGDLSLIAFGPFEFLSIVGITDGSPYDYITTRYWRIDSVNDAGTVTGDEWSFTTIRLDAPTVTYFYSTTGQYYQLLIQSDGFYGDSPVDGGVENTDYVFLTAGYEPNFIRTNRKLVAIAENRLWYEDI